MKRAPLLFVSLAANVALLAVLWRRPEPAPLPAPAPPKPAAMAAPLPAPVPAPAKATGAGTNDARAWLPELRAAGVPTRVLAQLVAAAFDAEWERRRDQLQERWERGEVDDDAWALLHRQRAADEEKAIRAALGDAAFKEWHTEKLLTGMHLDRITLSADEKDALYGLRRDLLEQQRELDRKHRAGEIDDAHISELQDALQVAYDAKTKALLGDDRYADLQKPSDMTAGALRRSLQSLNVSPAQTEAVLAAEQRWRDQRLAIDNSMSQEPHLSPEAYQAKVHALDEEKDATLLRELGAEGVEALRQLRDDRYRKLTKYAQLWQLSSDDINKVYGALRDYSQTIDEYRRQAEARGLSAEATQPVIDRFRQTTSSSLKAAIGEDKFKKLSASDVLDWDR